MIDTDKYEGHSPAPWQIAEGQPYDDEVSHIDIVSCYGVRVTETSYFTDNDLERHPNISLIADAPLLLEEVKRLREAITDIADNMEAADASYMGGFIEDLRKVIE